MKAAIMAATCLNEIYFNNMMGRKQLLQTKPSGSGRFILWQPINFEILACSYFYILLLATYIFWIRNKQKQRIRPHSQKCLVQVTRLTHHSKWKKSGFAYGSWVVGIFTAWSTILNPHWYMPNFFFDGSQSYIPDLGNKMGKIPLW